MATDLDELTFDGEELDDPSEASSRRPCHKCSQYAEVVAILKARLQQLEEPSVECIDCVMKDQDMEDMAAEIYELQSKVTALEAELGALQAQLDRAEGTVGGKASVKDRIEALERLRGNGHLSDAQFTAACQLLTMSRSRVEPQWRWDLTRTSSTPPGSTGGGDKVQISSPDKAVLLDDALPLRRGLSAVTAARSILDKPHKEEPVSDGMVWASSSIHPGAVASFTVTITRPGLATGMDLGEGYGVGVGLSSAKKAGGSMQSSSVWAVPNTPSPVGPRNTTLPLPVTFKNNEPVSITVDRSGATGVMHVETAHGKYPAVHTSIPPSALLIPFAHLHHANSTARIAGVVESKYSHA